VGADPAIAPEAKNEERQTGAGPSAAPEWDDLGVADRGTLARPPGAVWKVDDDLQSFPALAQIGCLGQDVCRIAGFAGAGEQRGLGGSFYRLDHRPGSSTRCRGKKSSAEREALGRSRGGFTTKIHVRCEGKGKLITFLLTPGQESDIAQAEQLMQAGAIRGHLRPKCLVADKGYTSQAFRNYLHQKHVRYTIPHRCNERHKGPFDKSMYRKRNIVERLINRLKQFRRIATRYDKRAANFAAMITIASIFLFSDFAYRL
jgi:transposase